MKNINTQQEFRLNSFFTGIGGFDLAFEAQGFKVLFQCEIDEYCRSVLRKHWPDCTIKGDIGDLAGGDIPDAEVWAAGFPCQDVSVARSWRGREGLRGSRSGLFFKFLELITERKPQVVLLENVTGLLNSHKGRDFWIVLTSFLRQGYGAAWRVLNTRYFGAPQSRPRVFFCAWKEDVDRAAHALFEPKGASKPPNERKDFMTPATSGGDGPFVPKIAFCLAATSGRHTGTDWSRSYVAYESGVRRLTPLECEGLQGFPRGWTVPTDDFVVANGNLDTNRYAALGNAVSIPVVEWIAARIAQGLRGEAPNLARPNQLKMPGFDETMEKLKRADPSFGRTGGEVLRFGDEALPARDTAYSWRPAGCAVGRAGVQARISPAPAEVVPSSLIDIVEKGLVDDRYYLSPNAAEGILRRVDSQGRTLFQPLRDALEKLASRPHGATK